MAILGDFSLSFLSKLPPDFDENDVNNIWNDRVFPLVLTADFTTNWTAISDPNGLFQTPSGERCRVEPQSHHVSWLRLAAEKGSTSTALVVTYEAIIFAKVAYKLSVGRERNEHPQLARRRFVDLVARKLPIQWRELIIQCDLHDYDETKTRYAPSLAPRVHSCLAHPKNIRLLTLLPNPRVSAPIECTLQEADCKSTPEYEALSYVWGTSPSRRPILLNGGEFSVGENLEAALRQLRPRDGHGRTLWIDAICIDQDNLQEKAHQVAQMDSIYKEASDVVVWLGRESNTSSEVFSYLGAGEKLFKNHSQFFLSIPFLRDSFHSLAYCPQCNGPPHDALPAVVSRTFGHDISQRTADDYARALRCGALNSPGYTNLSTRKAEAIMQLLCRPWWIRVWVLQEAILAKKITIHCGPRRADWTLFQAFLFLSISWANRTGAQHTGLFNQLSRNASAQSMLLVSVQRTLIFFFLQRASGNAHSLPTLTLANLLSLTVEFDATDPRDKLFALMSLLPDESSERLAFQPDYVTTTRRLYIRAAKHFLKTTNSLAVITARPLPDEHVAWPAPGETTLPSWVPNWGARSSWVFSSVWVNDFTPSKTMSLLHDAQKNKDHTEQAFVPPGEKMQLFNASLSDVSPFAFEFSTWDEMLGARGQPVDIIEETGPVWDLQVTTGELITAGIDDEGRRKADGSSPVSVFQEWKSVARAHHEGTYPFTNQSRLEVLWRTMLMDRYHLGPQTDPFRLKRLPSALSPENMAQVFKPWGIGCPFPPRTENDELLLIYYLHMEAVQLWPWRFNLHCASLRLFRTKKGYIGLCHPRARPGDEVAILFGASVPIVLREFEEGYVLIGPSYVHGVMDGEVIQDLRDQGKGMSEADFKLYKII